MFSSVFLCILEFDQPHSLEVRFGINSGLCNPVDLGKKAAADTGR